MIFSILILSTVYSNFLVFKQISIARNNHTTKTEPSAEIGNNLELLTNFWEKLNWL